MLIQRKDTLCHWCILREPRNLVLNAQQTGIDSCLSRRGWFWRHGWGASCPGAVCRGGGHSDRPVVQLGRGGRSTRQCPSGCQTETQEPPAERKPRGACPQLPTPLPGERRFPPPAGPAQPSALPGCADRPVPSCLRRSDPAERRLFSHGIPGRVRQAQLSAFLCRLIHPP